VIENELNAATDNPLVFVEHEWVLSGGNFHGQPLAMAFDIAAMAIAELGNISERRLELFLNPHLSGLNAFLATDEGINSGYMAMQYLSASLVNENKLLANPACTDSIPGNVGIEDHVSMGMTSARKLKRLVHNVKVILSIEMLAAAQAIDLRKKKPLGKGTQKIYDAIRKFVPPLYDDRIIAKDVEESVKIFEQI
jgi:histidine ammonia-lyase